MAYKYLEENIVYFRFRYETIMFILFTSLLRCEIHMVQTRVAIPFGDK